MSFIQSAETNLEDIFKKLPDMSNASRETLVNAWPWIALIFGVLQLLAAWGLWQLTRVTQSLINLDRTLDTLYPAAKPVSLSGVDKFIIYLGVLTLIFDGIILLLAYTPLKQRRRQGWSLLFVGALVNVAYSVIALFIQGRGFGSFFISLIGSAAGFYLLFQVKQKYNGRRSPRLSK